MTEALLWGLFAQGSLLLGAVVAIARPLHHRALGLIMGFGAGVLLSAVSFELMQKAVETANGLRGVFLGFFTGAAVFTAGDFAISRFGYANRKNIDAEPQDATGLAIVLGALLDGIPESAVLGLTLLDDGMISAAMLVAVFVSNVPEGIAATASLRNSGWGKGKIYALWSAITVAGGLSAAAGYSLLDNASPYTLAFMFAFAGGAILTMLATSMMPEAYKHAGQPVGIVTVAGFSLAFAITWLAG